MYQRDELEDEAEPDPFFLQGIDPDDVGVDLDVPPGHFSRTVSNVQNPA